MIVVSHTRLTNTDALGENFGLLSSSIRVKLLCFSDSVQFKMFNYFHEVRILMLFLFLSLLLFIVHLLSSHNSLSKNEENKNGDVLFFVIYAHSKQLFYSRAAKAALSAIWASFARGF